MSSTTEPPGAGAGAAAAPSPSPSPSASASTSTADPPRPDDVYKRGVFPPTLGTSDVVRLTAGVAELAAGWATAFARGMRVFSESLSGEGPRGKEARHDLVEASTESARAMLDELSQVMRDTREKLAKTE